MLRALYRAVTDRRAFQAITRRPAEEQIEDLEAAEEYKRKTRIAYYQDELQRCLEALRKVRGDDYIRMRKRISYIRGKIREKEYQDRYRKTEKFRKWKREYERNRRARRAGGANTQTNTDQHIRTRTGADSQRLTRGRPRKDKI